MIHLICFPHTLFLLLLFELFCFLLDCKCGCTAVKLKKIFNAKRHHPPVTQPCSNATQLLYEKKLLLLPARFPQVSWHSYRMWFFWCIENNLSVLHRCATAGCDRPFFHLRISHPARTETDSLSHDGTESNGCNSPAWEEHMPLCLFKEAINIKEKYIHVPRTSDCAPS